MEEITYVTNLLNMLGEWEKIEALVQRSIGGCVRLIDPEGTMLVGEEKLPPLCALIKSSEMGASRCQKSYAGICSHKRPLDKKGEIFRCHAGLSNFVLPVTYETKYLGFIVGGVVFCNDSHMQQANNLLRELRLDTKEGKGEIKQIPHISEGELKGIARIMQDVAGSFIDNLVQHEHLAQIEQQLRFNVYQGSDGFIIDDSTGVFSPTYMSNRLDKEISRARRYKEPLSLLVLEIENLRGINQHYGHQMGDVVLKEIAGILQRHARESETVARLSGCRFGIIFPRTTQQTAEKPAMRLKDIIDKHFYKLDDQILPLSPFIKMGVIEYAPQMQHGEDLLDRAIANLC